MPGSTKTTTWRHPAALIIEQRGWSQAGVSRYLRVSRAALSNQLHGRSPLTREVHDGLVVLLGLEPEVIFDYELNTVAHEEVRS